MDKAAIAALVNGRPEVRARLQTLNAQLRRYDLHFGYRVFDEIVSSLISADRNRTFEQTDDFDATFDAAVLMKVLPKFHGSRGRLEAPLRALLAWCVDPDEPDEDQISPATASALLWERKTS